MGQLIFQAFKNITRSLMLLFVSITICLICSELIVRKLKLVQTTSIQAKRLSPNELSYIPNSKWQYVEPEFTENVQINSIGYRDTDIKLNTSSIVFLGDSQTYGTGVQQGERASDLVKDYLNAKCPSMQKNVANISMPGASTQKELAMLNYVISKGLKVDHIFLMIVSNDHFQNFRDYANHQIELGIEQNSDKKITVKEKSAKLLRSLRYDSHLLVASLKVLSEIHWFKLFYAKSKILGGWGEILNTNILYYKNIKIQEQVSVTEKYIQQISSIAPTTLVLLPDRYRFDPFLQQTVRKSLINDGIDDNLIDFDTEGKLIGEVSYSNNLDLIDPIDEYRAKVNTKDLYYPINGHFTKNGQELLATNILKMSRYIQNECGRKNEDIDDSDLPSEFFQVSRKDPLDYSDDLL